MEFVGLNLETTLIPAIHLKELALSQMVFFTEALWLFNIKVVKEIRIRMPMTGKYLVSLEDTMKTKN